MLHDIVPLLTVVALLFWSVVLAAGNGTTGIELQSMLLLQSMGNLHRLLLLLSCPSPSASKFAW